MTTVIIDMLIIFSLLLCNGFLAMAEMAIVSARKARLTQWSEAGDKSAALALEIANSPTRFLSSIQIGITLVALLTGIFSGATIADDLSDYIKQVPHFAPHADTIAMGIVVTILTYVSLIVGELVPKRIALSSPESIAKYVALPLELIQHLTSPVVWLLTSSTETVIRVLGIAANQNVVVTEAEIQVLVEQATEAGIFEEVEQEMVESVLRLDIKKVSALMTPRRDIEWLDVNDDEPTWLDAAVNGPHTRLIVANDSLDKILGIVESKQLIKQKLLGNSIDLNNLLTQPMMVPESMTALDLIERFRESSHVLAVVLDEYGGVSGVISREDIFEAIVGELPLAEDLPKRWNIIYREEEKSWLVDGQTPIDEFKESLQIDAPLPGDGEADYRTVAGFVLYLLERVPAEGEHFNWNDLRFEVIDMDRHRIDKLSVSRTK